ncbi:MAG: hypothetical protein K0R18_514 [Bacillales bacterium]|jgi:hypothetical protein|nr:hypothetical protein [Bacillales bacterium]
MGIEDENGDDELSWNFTFSIAIIDDGFELDFFLDDTERDIMDSIKAAGLKGKSNLWMKEFQIKLKTFDEVKDFLNKHVWQYDLGYFY